jgi:hypothetical protein
VVCGVPPANRDTLGRGVTQPGPGPGLIGAPTQSMRTVKSEFQRQITVKDSSSLLTRPRGSAAQPRGRVITTGVVHPSPGRAGDRRAWFASCGGLPGRVAVPAWAVASPHHRKATVALITVSGRSLAASIKSDSESDSHESMLRSSDGPDGGDH